MTAVAAEPVVETLTCHRCGAQWNRTANIGRGAKPKHCPDCKAIKPCPICSAIRLARQAEPVSPGEKLAGVVTGYRLAILEASSAIRLGRLDEALAALDRVAAPGHA